MTIFTATYHSTRAKLLPQVAQKNPAKREQLKRLAAVHEALAKAATFCC
jgi:hypothetical protein